MLAQTDLYDVLVALIAAVPGTIAAVTGYMITRQIRTPSRTPIGKQVESVHHVALGNNYRLQTLTGELGANVPARASVEESKAQPPNGENSEKR